MAIVVHSKHRPAPAILHQHKFLEAHRPSHRPKSMRQNLRGVLPVYQRSSMTKEIIAQHCMYKGPKEEKASSQSIEDG